MLSQKDKKNEKTDKAAVGLAGEFLVMGELYRRGFYAAMTFGKTKKIDIFATAPNGGKTVRIQVKTTCRPPSNVKELNSKWPIGRKIWNIKDDDAEDYFFIFVLIHLSLENPVYKIAKASDVIEQTKKAFDRWSEEVERGARKYRGKLDKKERAEYPMKDFFSESFTNDGYRFLGWAEMFEERDSQKTT